MKKVKKYICGIMAVLIAIVPSASVSVFADENDDFFTAKSELENKTNKMEFYYLNYCELDGGGLPSYSDESTARMRLAVDTVRAKLDSYTTYEQLNDANELLDICEKQMYISKDELKFMIDTMKYDYEIEGYYDDTLYSELREVYEYAQDKYAVGSEEEVHIAYVHMRNMLNKLCLTVNVPGDVNNDGVFNIADITHIQKYLANLEEFTSAQCYAGGLDDAHDNITNVTSFQKNLAEIEVKWPDFSVFNYVKGNLSSLKEGYLYGYFEISDDTKIFAATESSNTMYYYNRYYKYIHPYD